MTSHFPEELRSKIAGFITRYETKRSSILPILHAIQDYKDWVSPEDVEALEAEFELSVVHVQEVLYFYTMYRRNPPEPWRFQVCNSLPCLINGSKKTLDRIEKELEDAKAAGKPYPMSCEEVECLGACGYAPVAFINKDRHFNVTPERALELMKQYRELEIPEAAKRCAAEQPKLEQ